MKGNIQKEEINNKLIIKRIIFMCLLISLLFIIILFFKIIYTNLINKKKFENSIMSFAEKNQERIFSINKIVFFSSADSKAKTSTTSNFTIENLYTYTDIAIFINNNSDENTLENTLKNLKITKIEFTKLPIIGQPKLYFKSINNFAKSEFDESNIINNELKYEITSEDESTLNEPILYNNCANPITFSYINQSIKSDYTITDIKNPLTYNGTLLKRCGIALSSIETSISFDIEIENNKNHKFRTRVFFSIPYEDETKSIYDGNYIIKQNANFNFYRYE